jgi:hypothetical protein
VRMPFCRSIERPPLRSLCQRRFSRLRLCTIPVALGCRDDMCSFVVMEKAYGLVLTQLEFNPLT